MGQELECRMQYQRRWLAGRAWLETDHILFRGEERVKIAFRELKSVSAKAGVLTLEFAGGPASLELGAAAERWADKIIHPPTRADKLGIRPGLAVRVDGTFDAPFLAELQGTKTAGKAKADLIFLMAPDREVLDRLTKIAGGLTPAGALWIVYPKGAKTIREVEVIQAGRAAGLKDVKVASFSPTHTALKFVIPVALR
jgi:hypothetical protein